MTPAGRLAVSYLAARRLPALPVGAFLLGGVLPDVDFLALPCECFNGLHRKVTHNLLFVVCGAVLAWCLPRRARRDQLLCGVALLLGGLVHVLVDACLDTNPSNGVGVALLWPWSGRMFSPFNLAPADLCPAGWRDARGMLAGLPWVLCYEVPLCVLALVQWKRGRAATRPG